MNVASLELCKELYGLTADVWLEPTDYQYAVKEVNGITTLVLSEPGRSWPKGYWSAWPAYDLGYLLRKLPAIYSRKNGGVQKHWYLELAIMQNVDTDESNGWEASYQSIKNTEGLLTIKNNDMIAFAPTPEDAACKLAIALFKEGILKSVDSDKFRKDV